MKALKMLKNRIAAFVTLLLPIMLLSATLTAQDITGKVVDQNGEPLVGATVLVKGTDRGVITDVEGRYRIVAGQNVTLQFSSIGYTTQEVNTGSRTVIDVTLSESSEEMEEIVVTALGIKKDARKLGYAATTISSKELTKAGSPNFATALYGKVPGLRISSMQGGSIAGVSLNVRGINSITGGGQPLIVMNGVPVRNGGTGGAGDASFAEFGAENRIRANGLIDINPEDIENLTVLRGAAATALYGSEAANGVIMIETKKAQKGHVSVDFSAGLTVNEIANVPQFQNKYGPGYFHFVYNDYMKKSGGFVQRTYHDELYESVTFYQYIWGPKYDGRPVLYWDGKVRPYLPVSDGNQLKDFFQTGFNQNYSISLNHGTDNSQTRFAYTLNDETPNTPTSKVQRHSFQLNGNLKLGKVVSVEYGVNYVTTNVHNRAQSIMGLWWSFSHGFGSFTDVPLMKKMYKTSLGYKNNNEGDASLTPDEQFAFGTSDRTGISNMLWDTYDRNIDEKSNRLLAHVVPKFQITDWLSARVQVSTDMTSERQELRSNSENPLALGHDPSGSYSMVQRRFDMYYGDFMLTANKKLTDKIDLTVSAGYQARLEDMLNESSATNGGLTTENWFNLNASRYQATTSMSTMQALRTAWLGMIDLAYDDYLYLTITGRQDKTSTLRKGANTFFYPSVSGSFIFTDAFRDFFPKWYQYGKLRMSFGVNGNYPGTYSANSIYDQSSFNDATRSDVPTGLGNDLIKPEITSEVEIGLESKMFNNRFGIDFTYYYRQINDQIMATPQAPSSGASTILQNIGTLLNYGVELNLYGEPVRTRDFSWKPILNISRNWNYIYKLAPGVDYIQSYDWAGGVVIRSFKGRPMGDFYCQTWDTNEKGEYLVNDEGYYINKANRELSAVGNSQPLFVGGFINNFRYKNLFFELTSDFVIGGKIYNPMQHYTTALGMTWESTEGREGGIRYYYPNNDNSNSLPVALAANEPSPHGEFVYDDGVIQPGVNKNTGLPNTQVVEYDYLTYLTNSWSTGDTQKTYRFQIYDRTYWKVRELSIGYNFPKKLVSKITAKHIQLSFFMRNLFYIYKAMPNWDVESSVGTSWTNQSVAGGSTAPNRSWGINLRVGF
jgi:TonB-linked SusC/RagA family outer membrane protein